MNITTRSMSKRAGRKFIALDSEDEDPDYELDTNVEETDLEEFNSEQEELSDISEEEEETGESGESGESGDSFIVEDSEDSDYDFEEEIALKYLDAKKQSIKIVDKKKLRENETILINSLDFSKL